MDFLKKTNTSRALPASYDEAWSRFFIVNPNHSAELTGSDMDKEIFLNRYSEALIGEKGFPFSKD